MTRIGKLRHRLVLEQPLETEDGAGGFVRTWQTVKTLWAALETTSSNPRWDADQAGVTITHTITLRYQDGITAAHRFRLGTRIFEIRHLRPHDERRVWMACFAEEMTP